MADDPQPGPADQPEDEPGQTGGDTPAGGSTPPAKGGSANSGWQLGGTPRKPGGNDPQPEDPFEALFSSFGGGRDMKALVHALQNGFSMLGRARSMFRPGTTSSASRA